MTPTNHSTDAAREAGQATNDLRHGFTITRGNERTTIKIRLNDECGNGHEDFSLTADIHEKRGNRWFDVGGGCCHEHILKLKPELAPFAALHLSTWEGIPTHAVANAFYWFAGFSPTGEQYHGGSGSGAKTPDECRAIFADHIRATEEQVAAIVAAQPRTKEELQAVLEDMGFPAKWKAEAVAAIAQLEAWTGKKFESKATRGFWEPLSAEARELIEQRKVSGYYSPEQVAERDRQAKEERKAKRIAGIRADHAARAEKLNRSLAVKLYFAERFDEKLNVIYYDHANEIAFNWSTLERFITREEFDEIERTLDRSALPEGVKLKWQERPAR